MTAIAIRKPMRPARFGYGFRIELGPLAFTFVFAWALP